MDRLSPLDAMFLNQDGPTEPRQIASLAILEPNDTSLTYDRLIQLINERLDIVPRYRQVPRRVPAALSTPVWVDDETFDISLHVRRSALPKPGSRQALHELVGRLIARRLDLDRPLWELYLIEGLEGGAVALLFKAHQALVDGSETIDLAQVLLEETVGVLEGGQAVSFSAGPPDWQPESARTAASAAITSAAPSRYSEASSRSPHGRPRRSIWARHSCSGSKSGDGRS